MSDLAEFKVLSFDCYGTLIDWERGISSELGRWATESGADVAGDRLLQLFSEIETAVQSARWPVLPYPEVLAETMRRLGRRIGVPVSRLDASSFGASVARWPAFDDSCDALAALSERFMLVIVSNIDRDSFAASQERLGVSFDRVITAEEVGAYKPASPHFEALLDSIDEVGVPRRRLLHVAQSLYHDHEPARRFGIESVWIDRRAGRDGWGATPPPQTEGAAPDRRFPSMESFAAAALA